MSGIGGITYGQSQYASSGSKLFGNKLFKEYLYFRERKVRSLSFLYTNFIKVSDDISTHLAEIWIRLKDYILVSHTRLSINVSKLIVETLALREPFITSLGRLFKDFVKFADNITTSVRTDVLFREIIRISLRQFLQIKRSFRETLSFVQQGIQRISGVFSTDNIKVLHKEPLIFISKVFRHVLDLGEIMRRKLNGLPMGWNKKQRSETEWVKSDRIQTEWEKQGRKDI
jgi:hypothetical protein